jgi:hypothetical protein
MTMLVNFVAFQIGWFDCVLGAARGTPWLGVAVAAAVVAFHLGRASRARLELTLILIAAAIGFVWDSALVMLGWIAYPNGALIAGTAPIWIVAMWVVFSTTLNVSLAWLKRSLPLAVVFGAVGGPIAYVAGEKLGGLAFVQQTPALIALAIGWAAITPLLLRIADRFDGYKIVPAVTIAPGAGHA